MKDDDTLLLEHYLETLAGDVASDFNQPAECLK